MTLFLDTSVLISACGSENGASRHVCECGTSHCWRLITSGYCRNETLRNFPRLGTQGLGAWAKFVEPRIEFVPDVISLDKALVFEKVKIFNPNATFNQELRPPLGTDRNHRA
jgi:hypothetical protein